MSKVLPAYLAAKHIRGFEIQMLEILDSQKHLVAMKLSGELTADDVTKAYKVTEDALKANERISFFAEIDKSVQLTFEGLRKDLVEGIGQIGKLKHYYRAAIVTDKSWMAALARVEGLVFSNIDVRVFSPDERDKAFSWASETPEPLPKPEEAKPSIHFLQTNNDKVFAYEVDGRISEKDLQTALKELKSLFDKYDKINILVRMKNWGGYDLSAILNDELVKIKYKSLSKVDKYAVVGAPAWMRNFLELIDPLFSIKMRVFDASEEEAAWEWIGARQALLAEHKA